MSVINGKIADIKEWWDGNTEWEQAKVISAIAVVIPAIAVLLVVEMNLFNEVEEFYITPVGWALWVIAPWLAVTLYLSEASIPAYIIAKITRRESGLSPLEAIANDYALLLKHVVYRGPYIIGALAAPIAIGALNLYILWEESGAVLSYSQMQTLIPMIGTFVVVVAMVQLAIIMHLLSPARIDINRFNAFLSYITGDEDG